MPKKSKKSTPSTKYSLTYSGYKVREMDSKADIIYHVTKDYGRTVCGKAVHTKLARKPTGARYVLCTGCRSWKTAAAGTRVR